MQTIIKDRKILFLFSASVILYIIVIFTGFTNFYGLTGKIIINYTEAGEPVLGDIWTVAGMITGLGIVISMNTALAYYLYFRERALSYILVSLNIFLTSLALWLVYLLNSFN